MVLSTQPTGHFNTPLTPTMNDANRIPSAARDTWTGPSHARVAIRDALTFCDEKCHAIDLEMGTEREHPSRHVAELRVKLRHSIKPLSCENGGIWSVPAFAGTDHIGLVIERLGVRIPSPALL